MISARDRKQRRFPRVPLREPGLHPAHDAPCTERWYSRVAQRVSALRGGSSSYYLTGPRTTPLRTDDLMQN